MDSGGDSTVLLHTGAFGTTGIDMAVLVFIKQLGLASPVLPGRSLTRCGSGVCRVPAYLWFECVITECAVYVERVRY